jgi:glutamate---cysteine ligase / carboxylate-amine ligase
VHELTVGVEEEYQLVDAVTGELTPGIAAVLPAAREAVGSQVEPELHQSQIEVGTAVCRSLDDVRRDLARLRTAVADVAQAEGFRLVAAATHPDARRVRQEVTPKRAYQDLAEQYGHLAQEQLVFGCHVHVSVPDDETAVQVVNRLRPWLSCLLALSGSSPFWEGVDTAYASYRTEVFSRWPMTGMPATFASRAEYDRLVDDLQATGAIDGPARLYWDARPSAKYETVEIRVADVCTSVDDAVLVAALARALVATAIAEAERGLPAPDLRAELVRAASWRAARTGIDDVLIDLGSMRAAPARQVVQALVDHVADALDASGDRAQVVDQIDVVFGRGTSARRQREVLGRTSSFRAIVDWLADETCSAC